MITITLSILNYLSLQAGGWHMELGVWRVILSPNYLERLKKKSNILSPPQILLNHNSWNMGFGACIFDKWNRNDAYQSLNIPASGFFWVVGWERGQQINLKEHWCWTPCPEYLFCPVLSCSAWGKHSTVDHRNIRYIKKSCSSFWYVL